jgi:hypothetical protein
VKHVIDQIERRKRSAAEHPFYDWLRGGAVALEDRFIFAPVFVNFIMGFSDINRWFMRYKAPEGPFERVINRHTFEDETHSRLFLEDWKKLGLDGHLGWAASDMIAWYFAAPETEVFREYGMEIMRMSTLHEDPFLRFAFMEAIEACGNLFFTATAPVAAALSHRTGHVYRYFGDHHLSREMGHVATGDCIFKDVALDEGRRQKARDLVDRIFDMFLVENDKLLSYAKGSLGGGEGRSREWPSLSNDPEAPAGRSLRPRERPAPKDAVLAQALARRKRAAAGHPLFRWMQEDRMLSPEKKLQHLAPLWTPDVMGYKDLCTYALRYKAPASARERAINRWLTDLSSHYKLFLRDWSELGMDGLLGWTAGDALLFFGLSKQTEVQRRSMAAFVKLAFAHPEPALRFWLIEALEASGEAFFHNTSMLARRVEASSSKRLDYFANRHDITHSAPGDEAEAESDAADLAGEDIGVSGREVAIAMIDTVFDCLEEQLTVSLELAPSAAKDCVISGP